MAVFKRVLMLVTITAVALALGACSRKITRIEQVAQAPAACFECHSDTTTYLVAAAQAWQYSVHASGSTLNETESGCSGCHTSEGFVARATGGAAPEITHPTAIGCFTCHAPHTNGDFRLRWTTPATLQDGTVHDLGAGNLCAACHQSRRNVKTYVTNPVTLSSRFGPHHGPQADMLIGSNGYEYAAYPYETVTHNTGAGGVLADGCLDCHYKTSTGQSLGGHSFNMTYSAEGSLALNTAACESCHPGIDTFGEIGAVRDTVDSLIVQLEARLTAAGLMANGAPKSGVKTSADSAGAVWNWSMVKEDRSHGAHNAKYAIGLLRSSIAFLTPAGAPPVAARANRR